MNIGNMAKGMNDVQRFDIVKKPHDDDHEMVFAEAGRYVEFANFSAMRSDRDEWKNTATQLQQQLAAAREALQAAEADSVAVFERAYATGYRAGLQASSAECRRQGEALDFSGNPYVRYADAIKCAAAIENMYVPAIDATLQRDRQP